MSNYMLMSGLVTEKSLNNSTFYNLEKFEHSKIDQLLSSLCSLANINLEHADFYLAYDDANSQFKEIVKSFIFEKFKTTHVRIYDYRLDSFNLWKTAAASIPTSSTSVLLMNNLDHVFIPESNNTYLCFLEFFKSRKENSIGGIMHWQETLNSIGVKKFANLTDGSPVFRTKTMYTHGTTLVNPNFFKSWWEKDFTFGNRIIRPDNPFGPWVNFEWTNKYIPAQEFFRHLDGYGHSGITSPYASQLRPCCRLIKGTIEHKDWTRGFKNYDFPDLPLDRATNFNFYEVRIRPFESFVEYLTNANSFRFSIIRSLQLIGSISVFQKFYVVINILLLLRDKHLQKAFIRNYLSTTLYRYRLYYYISTRYHAIRAKCIWLPKQNRNNSH